MIILRRKLSEYEKAEELRIRRNIKRRKGFKNGDQISENIENSSEKHDKKHNLDSQRTTAHKNQ